MSVGAPIFMVAGDLIVCGLILTVIWFAQDRRTRRHDGERPADISAAEILDRRLASGEIARDEYVRLRTALGADRHASRHHGPAA